MTCCYHDKLDQIAIKFGYNNKQHSNIGKLLFFVNLKEYLNICREGRGPIGKILEVDKFIYIIREARIKVEKTLKIQIK